MFSEITKVEKPVAPVREEKENLLDEYEKDLVALGNGLEENGGKLLYNYKGKTLCVKGIDMDFRVYLNDVFVCEIVMGHVQIAEIGLIRELAN
jgi:hypothetical protein